MQNWKKQNTNLHHKCIVVITKPKYRINNVFSWITRNIDVGKITQNTTIEDIQKFKKEMAEETAFRLNRFLKSNNNKKGVLIDPFKDCIEMPYYIIGDNLNKINVENNNYVANPLYSNDRIVSCNVTQETDNAWNCNITLNNTDDLYTLNNEYYYNSSIGTANTNLNEYILNQENTCVIEPNDEVFVFMSNWKEQLNSVFTGLVTSVTLSNDGLNKSVNLQCSDMFKKLSWSYKAVKASFDTREAFGTSLSVYDQNYADKSLSEVVKMLLGEALCDIYKRDDFLLSAVKSYFENKEGNKDLSLSVRIQEEIEKYIEIEEVPEELQKEKDSSKILRIIGYKCTVDYNKLTKNSSNTQQQEIALTQTVAGRTFVSGTKNSLMTPYQEGNIAFKISGLEQPTWAWTINSGSFDFLFSTFKRNDDFIREIAHIVAYEIFADVSGIVVFRPPNLVLPRKVDFKNIEFTKEYNEYLDNYIVTQSKEEDYFINFVTTADDSAIQTQIEVNGSFVEANIAMWNQRAKAYAPLQYINKYGIRMMQPVSRVGLQTAKSCEKYGDLLLWRQNKNYELASATCILNSDYTVGMPIFINKFIAVWYIKRVAHNFSAGNVCTTELTLGYKRTPLCYKKDLQAYLTQSLEKGYINQAQYDKIKKNEAYLTWGILNLNYGLETDKNKYQLIWEALPIELYDDIMEYDSQVDGARTNKGRKRKVTAILATKAKGVQDVMRFIVPPINTAGSVEAVNYDVNVSNSTTTAIIKKEQQEAMQTTDADIQKEQVAEAKDFQPKEFGEQIQRQRQILDVPKPMGMPLGLGMLAM